MITFTNKVPVIAAAILVVSSLFCVTVPVNTVHAATNGKIVFTTNRDSSGPDTEIYVMNADGSNQINVSNDASFIDKTPIWSPDGTKIAFHKSQFGPINEIYVVNADGSNPTNVTNQPGNDENPTWSPDGTKIAFQSNRNEDYEIYVMNVNGSNQTRLTNAAQDDSAPVWSPDGTKIMFQTNRDGNTEIYLMNANGSNQTNMSNDPSFNSSASWSADGTKIAYRNIGDVYVVNADGSNPTNVTNHPGYADWGPVWSPDGTKIVFQTNRDGSANVYLMNADGSNQVRAGLMPSGTNSAIFAGAWLGLSDVVAPLAGGIDPVATTIGAPNTGIVPATPLWQAIAIGAVGLVLFVARRVYLRHTTNT